MFYLYDDFGRYAGTSETETDRSTEIAPDELTADWNWNGVNWVYAPNLPTIPIVASPPSQAPRFISRIAFMSRFTDGEGGELEAIYTAARSSVAVEIWLEKFRNTPEIDLNDERTIDGLNKLEAVGIIDVGRAAEILS